MYNCQISWVNDDGNPTPDNNLAIGLAVCYDPRSFGEKGSKPFLICEHHAKQKGQFWKLLPLPQQEKEDWHPLVIRDNYEFHIIPNIISEAITNAFPAKAEEILKSLRKMSDHWAFQFYGMYVGIEEDGYMHT